MASLQITRKESVLDEMEQLHRRIAERAFTLSRQRNGFENDPVGDWLAAEQELVWKPAIEVREQDETVTILAALPGVEPKNIEVDVTPQDVVIKAELAHTHSAEEGLVHRCEFVAGQAFRSITLPRPIDAAKAKAELQHGMLRVTAPIASAARPTRIAVTAA
jgi:HSP20 family protein